MSPLDVTIGTLEEQIKILKVFFLSGGVLLSELKTKRRSGNLQETTEKEINYILIITICDI